VPRSSSSLGKRIGRRVYLHIETVPALDEEQRAIWERAIEQASSALGVQSGEQFNVVRLDFAPQYDGGAVADVESAEREKADILAAVSEVGLLHYPEFFADPFPALAESWRYVPANGTTGHRSYRDSLNPPILHRKELLLTALPNPIKPYYGAVWVDCCHAIGLIP
jgi:hypothetical protein